jgi:ABC-type transport system involved in multi-copper enzyme maturation permease subunit
VVRKFAKRITFILGSFFALILAFAFGIFLHCIGIGIGLFGFVVGIDSISFFSERVGIVVWCPINIFA